MARFASLPPLIAASALAALVFTPAARAGEAYGLIQDREVVFSASDLHDPQKTKALRERLRDAAREVCTLPNERRWPGVERRACERVALARAEAQLNARLAAVKAAERRLARARRIGSGPS